MAIADGETPTLFELRSRIVGEALEQAFEGGRLRIQGRDPEKFFATLRPEIGFAMICACEYADAEGPLAGDERLLESAWGGLEELASRFRDDGRVGAVSDCNSPYFTLNPMTKALAVLKDGPASSRHGRLVERCVWLFDRAAEHIDRTHDYLNPRGMEAASAARLWLLTGDRRFRDRADECLDELLARQYDCGAQPYHTGGWVWGRKPAQGYLLLTAGTMIAAGYDLDRPEALEYVRRLMDFEILTTNRRGECFVTTFEGLHKAHTGCNIGWHWPLGCALGDDRFMPLARRTYEKWAEKALDFSLQRDARHGVTRPRLGGLGGLERAHCLHVRREPPPAPAFEPPRGLYLMQDISAVAVHEPGLDVCMSLLCGYSSLAEADCGSVKLFAVGPELTDEPGHGGYGSDALRLDWRTPSEQLECARRDGGTVLRGHVYTKWIESGSGRDAEEHLHTRKLDVTMQYRAGALTLRFETVENKDGLDLPVRLLFLLYVRPHSENPVLTLGGGETLTLPCADATQVLRHEWDVQPVSFAGADGSAVKIDPVKSCADRLTAERPPDIVHPLPGKPYLRYPVKFANEGSLRLAFEGPRALERGEYVIRFEPARG